GPAVRRAAGRRLRDAGPHGHADRHRARRPVAHRAVHRRPAARARDLPAPDAGRPDARGAPRRAPPGARDVLDHPDDAGGGRMSAGGPTAPSPTRAERHCPPVSWRAPAAYAVSALLSLVFFARLPAGGQQTTFRLSAAKDFFPIEPITVSSTGGARC